MIQTPDFPAADNAGILFYYTLPTNYTEKREAILDRARYVSPSFADLINKHLPERTEKNAGIIANNEVARDDLHQDEMEKRVEELLTLTNPTDVRTCMAWAVDVVRGQAQPLRALYWCPNDPRAKRFLEHVMTCLGVTYQVWEVK